MINERVSPRRRGFAAMGVLSAGALLFSTTHLALSALAEEAKNEIDQLARKPEGAFSQAPTPAFRGLKPGRDRNRGGLWTDSRRARIRQFQRSERLTAQIGTVPSTSAHTLAVDADPGTSLPWEGSAAGVNTGNGNKLTSLNLLSWKVRGGMTLDFTLYHNSQTTYNDELGTGWTWTYDVYINNLAGDPVLHYGDGTAVPYGAPSGGTTPGGPDAPVGPGIGEEARYEPASGTVDVAVGVTAQSPTSYTAPAGIYDALVKNADATWTLTKKDGTKYRFNASGFLTSIMDRNGNTISLTLNASNYVTKITDPTGRYVNVSLDSGNNFQSITDHTGRTWTFTRDINDDLTSVGWPTPDGLTYADGFSYSSHRISTHADRRGKNWSYGYNTDGSLASETDPLGHALTYTYLSSATTITDSLGHASTHNYASGKLASSVDSSGFSTSYTSRDTNNNITTVVDPRGKTWTYTFDTKGNALTSTNPLGKTTTFTYNAFSQPLTVVDPLGHATTNTYDANGNLLTKVDGLGKAVLTNTVGTYGLLSSTKDALNKTSSYTYDSNGNVATLVDATARTQGFTYDSLSRQTASTDPASHTTTTAYDAWDRPVSITFPSTGGTAAAISTAYLATGQVWKKTDELGHVTTNAYDDAGRLTSVTNPRGDIESYGYDAADHRTSVTNGRGKVRTYTFTNRGEVAGLTQPDGAAESWTYDGEGNVTSNTNALGQTILRLYDDAGRQTKIDYPTGTDTTFGYDDADRRTSMVDSTGTTTWSYDAVDRPVTFSSPQGSQTTAYDDAGHRIGLTGTGVSRSWTYDDAGRVATLTNEQSEVTNFEYDTAGELQKTTLGNGQVSIYAYDARGRETSVTHKASATGSTISSESNVYDDAGNLSSKTVDGTTTTYGYDVADQITSEARSGYSASYTFDANGNRTSKTLGGVTETYTVDDGDKLTSVTQGATTIKSYTYDAAGRTKTVVSSTGTTTLNYDYDSRVTGITYPGGGSNSFTYNGLDARVSKVDSAGTSTYRREGADVLSPVIGDGSAVYTPGISQRRGGATTYDLPNHQGTVSRQTNASAATTATHTYDAFGVLVASTGTPQGPFGFVGAHGYQEDSDSGLKLLGHRYYDASTGRFLTRDPAQDGRNWYAYCGNNPVRRYDNRGLFWEVVRGGGAHGGGGLGIGLLVGDKLYQRGTDTIRWIGPNGGRGGSRIIMIDRPHAGAQFPHLNADLPPLRGIDHMRIPPWVQQIGKPAVLKGVGKALIFIGIASDVYDLATATPEERPGVIGGIVGGWGGAAGGAALGTLICPGVGTVIGGVIGGIGGYFGGKWVGGLF